MLIRLLELLQDRPAKKAKGGPLSPTGGGGEEIRLAKINKRINKKEKNLTRICTIGGQIKSQHEKLKEKKSQIEATLRLKEQAASGGVGVQPSLDETK